MSQLLGKYLGAWVARPSGTWLAISSRHSVSSVFGIRGGLAQVGSLPSICPVLVKRHRSRGEAVPECLEKRGSTTFASLLAKHAHVEFETLWGAELNSCEIRMSRIQQDVPSSANSLPREPSARQFLRRGSTHFQSGVTPHRCFCTNSKGGCSGQVARWVAHQECRLARVPSPSAGDLAPERRRFPPQRARGVEA